MNNISSTVTSNRSNGESSSILLKPASEKNLTKSNLNVLPKYDVNNINKKVGVSQH